MIPILVTAVFFVAIVAALQFSMWAEGWLSSRAIRVDELAPDPTSPNATELPELTIDHEAAPAA
jgi:hypothetical protein